MCCDEYTVLQALQQTEVARLEQDLQILTAEGNDYHAAIIEHEELPAARSLARLTHTHKR